MVTRRPVRGQVTIGRQQVGGGARRHEAGWLPMTWTVPEPFVASRGDLQLEWARSLGSVAAGLARDWSLEPAGDPMWGYVSVVWPVRGPSGESWVLKLSEDDPRMRAEGLVLRAWQGPGVVELVRHDAATGALLLEALDAGRDLEGEPDVDAATEVIGGFIARFTQVPAPEGVPSLADELRRISGHLLAAARPVRGRAHPPGLRPRPGHAVLRGGRRRRERAVAGRPR